MLSRISMQNLGPLRRLDINPAPAINLVVGPNSSGKTLLLKSVYALLRAHEEFGRGHDPRTFRQVLDDKLYWTFQLDRLGALVSRGADGPLSVEVLSGDPGDTPATLSFTLTAHAERKVGARLEAPGSGRDSESILIPAKEVLSVASQVKESRSQQKFGFDEPTLDLVKAVEREPSRGKPRFGGARSRLERALGGRLAYQRGTWTFAVGRAQYPVAITAEGAKKIAILDRLIVNRTLSERSVLFFDEPESFLHPRAQLELLRVLAEMSRHGVQVFLATHSLFVLNAMRLYARESQNEVSLVSLKPGQAPEQHDLRDSMPDNELVDASLTLYELELEGRFDG